MTQKQLGVYVRLPAWVAAKEINLSYYIGEALLTTIYVYFLMVT